jgi:hypothetical protein
VLDAASQQKTAVQASRRRAGVRKEDLPVRVLGRKRRSLEATGRI